MRNVVARTAANEKVTHLMNCLLVMSFPSVGLMTCNAVDSVRDPKDGTDIIRQLITPPPASWSPSVTPNRGRHFSL
jgi:hypothetical protein